MNVWGYTVQGRGLGRMFLRHLRRTRIILHVVDAATGMPCNAHRAELPACGQHTCSCVRIEHH